MSSAPDPRPDPIIRQWREANIQLTNAVSEYLRSCLALESLSDFTNASDAQDLTLNIDHMINLVPKIAFEQLVQSCSSLARTRSRLVTSIYSLPAEILSEVFRLVFHSPYKAQPFKMGIRSLYHRLHTLISVCSEWRRIGLARTDFWTLVPIIHDGSHDLDHITGLSLQRSGNSSLDIAADLGLSTPKNIAASVPPEYATRFRSLNIRSKSEQGIKDMVTLWLLHGVPGSATELSICYAPEISKYGVAKITYSPESPTQHLLPKFLAPLSTLRISRTLIYLDNICFDTLTELWIDQVEFSWPEGRAFFRAVSSMPSLRELHIISVYVAMAPSIDPDLPENRLSILLPSLQTLYLENVKPNLLQFIFASITPGPYSIVICIRWWNFNGNYSITYESDPSVDRILRVLEGVNVSALLFDTNCRFIISPLLPAFPSLRALYFSLLCFDERTMRGLIRPSSSSTPFPMLRELHVGHVMTESPESNELFKDVVSNHAIENMTLGGDHHGCRVECDASSSFKTLPSDDGIVTWLRSRVPKFRLIDHRDGLPELKQHRIWQLW